LRLGKEVLEGGIWFPRLYPFKKQVRTPKNDNIVQYKPQNVRGIRKILFLYHKCNIYLIFNSQEQVITTA
jgi:hypothetical protein